MKLTLTQKRILELLSINCRFSNKDIAKSINVSEDTVDYQINKLIKEKKLAQYSIQFNYFQLGYSLYHIFIRISETNVDYAKLNAIQTLISINSSYGKFDLQLIALVKEAQDLDKTIKKIESILDIKEISICQFSDQYKTFTNILSPFKVNTKIPQNKKNRTYKLNTPLYPYADPRTKERFSLDKTDKKIIKELLKEPRIKFSDLARITKINHETIRYRINNYVKEGLITNFGLIHDFKKYDLYASCILLKLTNTNDQEFKAYLENNHHIFFSPKLIGEYSCIIYLLSSNPIELGNQLRKMKTILKKSLISMDLLPIEHLYKYKQFPEDLLRMNHTLS